MQDGRHNAANAISTQKEYAAIRKRVYGQVNRTVAVHCTDILEQKMGEGQRMYFPQKQKQQQKKQTKKQSSRSQALSSQPHDRLRHAYLYLPL